MKTPDFAAAEERNLSRLTVRMKGWAEAIGLCRSRGEKFGGRSLAEALD